MFFNLIFVSGVPWHGEVVFKAPTLAQAEHYLAANSLSEVKLSFFVCPLIILSFHQKS